MATWAATPMMIAEIYTNNRFLLERASRQAIFHDQLEKNDDITPGRLSVDWFYGGAFHLLVFENGPVFQVNGTLALLSQRQVVGHQYQGGAVYAIEIKQKLFNGLSRLGVKIAGGLIGKKYFWFIDESTGDRYALLLSAGKLGRVVVQPVLQTHFGEKLFCVLSYRFRFYSAQFQRYHHVLQSGEGGYQLKSLKNKSHIFIAHIGAFVLAQGTQLNWV